MSHSLALYNAHKRSTLDRLTLTYQLKIRAIYRAEMSHVTPRMIDALKYGHHNFHPEIPGSNLEEKLHSAFQEFQDAAISAGFSDGIQEVSPEGKLNLWEKYPVNMPIENTIILEGGAPLVKKRDKFADKYKDVNRKTLSEKLHEYISGSKDSYLKSIRKAYSSAAKSWFSGESDASEVKILLKRALQITDNDAERTLRTETTNYFNSTRSEYFKTETDVDYIELYAVTDGRISKICEDRHGFCVPINQSHQKKYCPAFHPNCRTVQRPLFSTLKSHAAIIEKSKSINEASFTPLPKGWA